MADALRLTMDYFQLSREEFLKRWLPKRDKEIARQTTPASWRSIVEALRNPAQTSHRHRRARANQCAGAGWPRLGQNPRAGAPHRLPAAGEVVKTRMAFWRWPTTATPPSRFASALAN
jgi:hypothetical protein